MRRTCSDPDPGQLLLDLRPPQAASQPTSALSRFRLALVEEAPLVHYGDLSSEDTAGVARFLEPLLDTFDREVVGVLLLAGSRVIGLHLAYIGLPDRALVEPRGLLAPALLAGASGILVFHNHPSGDPTPSTEDVQFTRRLSEAADLVGIALQDHLVIGENGRFRSLRHDGAL